MTIQTAMLIETLKALTGRYSPGNRTQPRADSLGVPVKGPFKPDHYRD